MTRMAKRISGRPETVSRIVWNNWPARSGVRPEPIRRRGRQRPWLPRRRCAPGCARRRRGRHSDRRSRLCCRSELQPQVPRARRAAAESEGAEAGQQTRCGLHENDPGGNRIDHPELLSEATTRRARRWLRRSSTPVGPPPTMTKLSQARACFVGAVYCSLGLAQYLAADVECILDALQPGSERFPGRRGRNSCAVPRSPGTR